LVPGFYGAIFSFEWKEALWARFFMGGLRDRHGGGVGPRLSESQLSELAGIVEAGPDIEKDGIVRWRRIDLKRVIKERFNVEFHERYVGVILEKLGFSHISARPRHPGQDVEIIEAFKKTLRPL